MSTAFFVLKGTRSKPFYNYTYPHIKIFNQPELEIDLSTNEGIYLIRIDPESEVVTEKLLISR